MKRKFLNKDELKKITALLLDDSFYYDIQRYLKTKGGPFAIINNESFAISKNVSAQKEVNILDRFYESHGSFYTMQDFFISLKDISRFNSHKLSSKDFVETLMELEEKNIDCFSPLKSAILNLSSFNSEKIIKMFLLKVLLTICKNKTEKIDESIVSVVSDAHYNDKKQDYYLQMTYLNEFLSPTEKIRLENEIKISSYSKETREKLLKRMNTPIKKKKHESTISNHHAIEITDLFFHISNSNLKQYVTALLIQTINDQCIDHARDAFNYSIEKEGNKYHIFCSTKNLDCLKRIEFLVKEMNEQETLFSEFFKTAPGYLEFKKSVNSIMEMNLLKLNINEKHALAVDKSAKIKL